MAEKEDFSLKFSNSAKEVISYSREEAIRLRNDYIGSEHIILGIIRHNQNNGFSILDYAIDSIDDLRKEFETSVNDKTTKTISELSELTLPLTKQAEKVIRVSVLEAKEHNVKIVDPGCILLSILRNKESIACQTLEKYNLDYQKANILYFQFQSAENETTESMASGTVAENENEIQVQRLLERVIEVSIKDSIEGVLDIENESSEIATLLTHLSLDQGMMFGLFGQWGRGKTFFWRNVWKDLSTKSNLPFYKAEFHAWKYQDTPASWAYLYEILACSYFDLEKYNCFLFKKFAYWFKRIKLNIKRKGVNLLSSFLLMLSIFVIWHFLIPLESKLEFFLRVIMSLGIIVFIKLIYLYFVFKPMAISVLNQYTEKVSFQQYLGLQAEIQKEIAILLQTWIPRKIIGKKRVLLFIDDIDRCNEAKIIQIIDSLRIMLDEPEIAKRCVILAAIDERILKIAISTKYYELVSKDFNGDSQKKINLNNLVREYMDKLFVGGIKLRTLNQFERKEILESLTKGKIHIEEGVFKISEEKPSSSIEKKQASNLKNTDFSKPIIATKEAPKEENFELESFEYKYLQDVLESCGSITPRIIRIFYYRYLLAKRFLFIKTSHDTILYDKWHNSSIDKSILPYLIMFFTVNISPEEINASYFLWSNNSTSNEIDSQIQFTLLGKNFTIDNSTLKELLQIIEITVPY